MMRQMHKRIEPRRTGQVARRIRRAARPVSGFALGLILIAIALMSAITIALMLSSRTNLGEWDYNKARTLGAGFVAQGRALRDGVAAMTGNGADITTITFDTSGTAGLFNASIGGTEKQVPDAEAIWSSTATYVWKVDSNGNPVVKLNGVGADANPDYVVMLPNVSTQACLGINIVLHAQGIIPQLNASLPLSSFTTPGTPIDLSASNSGTQGWSEGCFYFLDTSNGGSQVNVYINTIRPE